VRGEVVTFILASFGGYLKNIAPPDPVGASFPVGALWFLALILLMIIAAISRKGTSEKTIAPGSWQESFVLSWRSHLFSFIETLWKGTQILSRRS
jgi:hypothetical protein